MSVQETINPVSSIPGIGTISASIPFDYRIGSSSSLNDVQTQDEIATNYCGVLNYNISNQSTSPDMIPLQNMSNNITEDVKLRDMICSETKTVSMTSAGDIVRLQLVEENNELVPRLEPSLKRERTKSMDNIDNIPYLPPQIHVNLYRPKSLTSLKKSEDTTKVNVNDFGIENQDHFASSPDLRNGKAGNQKPSLSKLRSRFQRTKSVPVLSIVPEENTNEGSSSPRDSSSESININQSKNNVGIRKMFTKNKRASKNYWALIAQHRKHISTAMTVSNGPSEKENINKSQDQETMEGITDSKKLEIEEISSSGVTSSLSTHDLAVEIDQDTQTTSITNNNNNNNNNNDNNNNHSNDNKIPTSATIKIAKRPHFRGGQYCTFLTKFITTLPPDEIAEKPIVIKDATDVLPLDNGEAIVTDILSNKLVLFDVHGYPRITFSVEKGSEPWSGVARSDNDSMAVTLKGEGCVCLWSTKGEALTDFGQDILSSPTGIHFDRLGRFVVLDEEKNSIFLFSRTGNYLGEFVNQDSLNPFAGNKIMETLNQPRYVTGSRDGLYFVSDSANQIVKIFDEDGNILRVIGSYGREDGQFRFPYGVAFDEETKLLYVADHFNNRISVFGLNGTFLYHILTQEDGITRPKGLAIQNSKLYVTFGNLRAGNVSVFHIHANAIEDS